MQEIDRELEWKKKRAGLITSSEISKLFKPGKKKTDIGKGAIDYINEILFEIKEGDLAPSPSAWQMDFGKENEPLAIEWIKNNIDFGLDVVSGTNDNEDIEFRKWHEGAGDSPDGDIFNSFTKEHIAVVEIKCPANKIKACKLTDGTAKRLDVLSEYRDQLCGHLKGAPEAKEVWYVIYNAHQNELSGKYYDRGVIFKYTREELQPRIEEIEERVDKVWKFIQYCLETGTDAGEINNWWLTQN